MRKSPYILGQGHYEQKPNSKEFVMAARKLQEFLQEEENKKNGRKAKTVTYVWVTKYIYENFMRGRQYGVQ